MLIKIRNSNECKIKRSKFKRINSWIIIIYGSVPNSIKIIIIRYTKKDG